MQLGYIGLGKMGFNMVRRLLEKKHEVITFNRSPQPMNEIAKFGAKTVSSLQELVNALTPPRLIWIMVSHQAVDEFLEKLTPLLRTGDTIIDGGNTPYKKSMQRAEDLWKQNINFLDVGTSGGPNGAYNGTCLMIGGKEEAFQQYENLFKDIAADNSYGYMGSSGAGHFVKMVHNGIEYGMMQAIAEGFAVMKKAPFNLQLQKIADLYNHKSVIKSRLVGWLKDSFEKYGENLNEISGKVSHSGEGQWTVETSHEFGVPVPVIEDALKFRIESENKPSFTGKILSALRNQFGGHNIS